MLEVVCTFLAYTNLVFFQIMCTNTTTTEVVREWLKNFFFYFVWYIAINISQLWTIKKWKHSATKMHRMPYTWVILRDILFKYQHRRSLCLSTFSLQVSGIYLLKSILRINTYACNEISTRVYNIKFITTVQVTDQILDQHALMKVWTTGTICNIVLVFNCHILQCLKKTFKKPCQDTTKLERRKKFSLKVLLV